MLVTPLYQNVSILDFIGAKDDGGGGDNCSCKTCKVIMMGLGIGFMIRGLGLRLGYFFM